MDVGRHLNYIHTLQGTNNHISHLGKRMEKEPHFYSKVPAGMGYVGSQEGSHNCGGLDNANFMEFSGACTANGALLWGR